VTLEADVHCSSLPEQPSSQLADDVPNSGLDLRSLLKASKVHCPMTLDSTNNEIESLTAEAKNKTRKRKRGVYYHPPPGFLSGPDGTLHADVVLLRNGGQIVRHRYLDNEEQRLCTATIRMHNTCTVDNILTCLVLAYRDIELVRATLTEARVPRSVAIAAFAAQMLAARSPLEAQKARFDLLNSCADLWAKRCLVKQGANVVYGNLFGSDADFVTAIFGQLHTFFEDSICSNSSCSIAHRASPVTQLLIPVSVRKNGGIAINQTPDIAEVTRTFQVSSTAECSACHGTRQRFPLRYSIHEAFPPMLVLAFGDFAGPQWARVQIPELLHPYSLGQMPRPPQ
jgi:hypothetical protein